MERGLFRAARKWLGASSLAALVALGCASAPRTEEVVVAPAPQASAAPAAAPDAVGVESAIAARAELTPRERQEWAAELAALPAPCAELAVNLARCVGEGRACRACRPAAELLARQVHRGKPKVDRERAFRARFDPAAAKTIPLDGVPARGRADAPVTVVVWIDLECPFCKMLAPVLDEVQRRHAPDVRLAYRIYPLSAHPHAEPAARAVFAADRQQKFWPMLELVLMNQENLERADLEKYAGQLKLDVPRLRADAASAATSARIAADVAAGDRVGLDGTPFIFINGRNVDLSAMDDPVEELDAWVALELDLRTNGPPAHARE